MRMKTGCLTPMQASVQPIIHFGMMLVKKPKWSRNQNGKMNLQLDGEEIQQLQNQQGSNICKNWNNIVWVELVERDLGESNYESGVEIRAQVVETDSLAAARETNPLCPFCENLFEEAPLAELIKEEIEERECSRLQLGARIRGSNRRDHLRKVERGVQRLSNQLVEEVARHLNDLGMARIW